MWTLTGLTEKRGKRIYKQGLCACGTLKFIRYDIINVEGHSTSCGCEQPAKIGAKNTKHGGEGTKLYFCWNSMRQRCNSPMHKQFSDYGGRGITVCPEWSEFAGFRDWALGSGYAEGLHIDRIDNNAGYYPHNCRWVTARVNQANRRNTVMVEAWGEVRPLAFWVEDPRSKVTRRLLAKRLNAGWGAEEAISSPSKPRRKAT